MAQAASAPMRELEVELEAEVLEQLERVVARPSFLHALENAASSFMPRRKGSSAAGPPSSSPQQQEGGATLGPLAPGSTPAGYHPLQTSAEDEDAEQASSSSARQNNHSASLDGDWEASMSSNEDEDEAAASSTLGAAESSDFIVVQQDDALEAMAFYIAQCLAKHPEARNMTPKQLQQALSSALSALKQSKFKRFCRVGRTIYRWSTITYSALQMYQNPWLIQAVLTALWTLSRMSVRALLP